MRMTAPSFRREESLVYPRARLGVDSGTGDNKEAPEDEEEEVMLNLRSLWKNFWTPGHRADLQERAMKVLKV